MKDFRHLLVLRLANNLCEKQAVSPFLRAISGASALTETPDYYKSPIATTVQVREALAGRRIIKQFLPDSDDDHCSYYLGPPCHCIGVIL